VTDGEALVRSVLATPADDAPRLIYADWLDEQGRAEDAEFIRVQVELARLGFDGAFHTDEHGGLRHVPEQVVRLTERQLELWYDGFGRPDLPAALENWPIAPHQVRGPLVRVRRGFVERVSCRCGDFLAVAAELFGRQPVIHVRLVDRQAVDENTGWGFGWYCADVWEQLVDDIPPEVWKYLAPDGRPMVHFPTSDEADAALGWACVRYGRAKAGLGEK